MSNVRRFDGGDKITLDPTGNMVFTGAITVIALVKRATDATWDGILYGESGANVLQWGFGLAPSGGADLNKLEWSLTAGNYRRAITTVAADGWQLCCVTKAAGTTTPRMHRWGGGAWTHTNADGTLGNAAAWDDLYIGGLDQGDDLNADVAFIATWDSALTDTQLETINSIQAALALSPDALWLLDQPNAADIPDDMVGTHPGTAVTGTTVVSDTISWFDLRRSAGPAFVQSAVRDDGINGDSAANIASIAKAWANNTTTGNLIAVWVWAGVNSTDDTASWTVTDSQSNVYTRLKSDSETEFNAGGSTGSTGALFVCESIIGGTTPTITVTFPSPTRTYGRMVQVEYAPVAGGAKGLTIGSIALDDVGRHESAGADLNRQPEIAACANDIICCGVQSIPGGVSYSVGSGMRNFAQTPDDGFLAFQDKMITLDGVYKPTFTSTGASPNSYGITWIVRNKGNASARARLNP